MQIDSTHTTIREFLGGSTQTYSIPEFQRIYSWDESQLEELWEDILTSPSGEHFIGSIITYAGVENAHSITDGQQRITSIALLIAAIRDAFAPLSEDSAAGLQKYLETTDDDITARTLRSIARIQLRTPSGTFTTFLLFRMPG